MLVPSYTITFDVRRPDTMDLPSSLLSNGVYKLAVAEDGSVEIAGNRDGLLYLAEVLVRCAIGEYTAGHHVHFPLDSSHSGPNLDASPELTIHAAVDRLTL
jgi:hypothetical protein